MINVFVPSHITGFFSIFDSDNLLEKGSLGLGVLLDKGVITSIKQLNSKYNHLNLYFDNKLAILINDEQDIRNQTIIIKLFELMFDDIEEFKLKFSNLDDYILINQTIQVPIGCGFGTSASAAIGTAICINEFFDLNLSMTECGKYAHLAELSLGSGLGDVIAELSTGIVKRVKPGAPGTGEVESINLDEELFVLTKTFDSIETASIIENPSHNKRITEVGIELYNKFNKDQNPKTFMDYSLEFAKETNLISEDILKISKEIGFKTIGISMAMLGNTAFALINNNQRLNLLNEGIIDDYGFEVYKLETEGIKIW